MISQLPAPSQISTSQLLVSASAATPQTNAITAQANVSAVSLAGQSTSMRMFRAKETEFLWCLNVVS